MSTDWPTAFEYQLPPSGDWRVWLLVGLRGAGKTRAGAEWARANVRDYERVNLIGPDMGFVRDVMVEAILGCCPPDERPEYLPAKRLLEWPNGARSYLYAADEPNCLRGHQFQRLWGDEFSSWPNREQTWKDAKIGLRLPPDPRACLTTSLREPLPFLLEIVEDTIERDTVVVTTSEGSFGDFPLDRL